MVFGRWGHVFVTSANPRSCKKNGHVALFKIYCSWGRLRSQNVQIVQAVFVRGGIPPAHINHDTEAREISY